MHSAGMQRSFGSRSRDMAAGGETELPDLGLLTALCQSFARPASLLLCDCPQETDGSCKMYYVATKQRFGTFLDLMHRPYFSSLLLLSDDLNLKKFGKVLMLGKIISPLAKHQNTLKCAQYFCSQ